MNRVRLAVTGSRHGLTYPQQASLATMFADTQLSEFHYGCCIGADTEALWTWVEIGNGVAHAHPATMSPAWDAKHVVLPTALDIEVLGIVMHPPEPPLDRNRTMVDNADIVWAFPADESNKGGTWATINYARSKGVPVTVVLP